MCFPLFASAFALGSLGFARKPRTETLGAISCRSCTRFATSAVENMLTPVMLPPGRFKLATRPLSTGSEAIVATIVIVAVAALAACTAWSPPLRDNHSDWAANQLGNHARQPFALILRPAVFDRNVSAFVVADFAQALTKRGDIRRPRFGRKAVDKADHRHRHMLRVRRERPRECCAAQGNYEFPPCDFDRHRTLQRGSRALDHCE